MMRPILLVLLLLTAVPSLARAQQRPDDVAQRQTSFQPREDLATQTRMLTEALISLPLATGLGAMLAFRPRRRSTPDRKPAVVHTQIILALVGAIVMLVVGQSLARAFGIVGAASLIRYRAKVDDPKDAGVMLAALGIGLASGVGLYLLAAFSAVFVLGVLWMVESFEPGALRRFTLKITAKEPEHLKREIERVLQRNHARFDLRTANADEIRYDVQLPIERRTEAVSNQLLGLKPAAPLGVEWEEGKN
jgi:uncharacterized membrane protein YhiD involved in acid resistance